ncbi:MAG TPA: YhjD/YihY/BrkB family envelope integrity protein [Gaiellaceae bacterium]|nr:YhjD/YihY/BrkB family envelope integrity protein [Gaiellaceae bacterium]
MRIRLKRFVKLWIDLFNKHELLDRASGISFAVMKALVPLTLLGLAMLGAVGQRHVWKETMFPALKPHVQPATARAIDTAVEKIFSTDSASLIVFASIVALWYISGSVRGVMTATNRIYECDETRSWKVRYPLSIGLAAAIAVCVIAAALAVLAAPALVSSGALEVVVTIGRWLVAVVLLAVAVGLLVRYAPVEPRPNAWISGGSLLVILAWVAASMIFRLLVTTVLNFRTATGGLAVFLVLSAYVYTSSIIFLLGVEVDELLREDAAEGERGLLETLGLAR